jgi:hypothetical protein
VPSAGATRWFLNLKDYMMLDSHIIRAGAGG